jgi:hypothetical protein
MFTIKKKHTSEHPLPDLRPDLESCANFGLEQTLNIFKNIQKHISSSGVRQGHSKSVVIAIIHELFKVLPWYMVDLKVNRSNMGPYAGATSARARGAIYSRATAIRIYSVPRFRHKNSFVKISSWAKVIGFAEYFCRLSIVWIFQIWPYPRQNPM